jgi:DNA-binding transcriptional LysR family regulator
MQDLNDLVYFAAVVENKGFSAAARALNLPKSTVSRHIEHLEARLRMRLLERSTRRLRVTDAGTIYYERCRAILADLESAEQDLSTLRSEPSGIVRLSAPTGIAHYAVASILPDFMARHPQVRVQVVASDKQIDLFEDKIDIAIRARTQLRDEMLMMRKLGTSFLVFVANPDFLSRHRIKGLESVTDLPFLCARENTVRHRWTLIGPGGRKEEIGFEPQLWTSDFNVIREAACAGLGLALLPMEVVRSAIAQGRLTRVLPDWQSEDVTIHLVFTSQRSLTPAARLLVDYLVENFELVFDCSPLARTVLDKPEPRSTNRPKPAREGSEQKAELLPGTRDLALTAQDCP